MSVSSSVSNQSFGGFDSLGRVESKTQTTGGTAYQMFYAYNRAGGLISETYPSGRVIETKYDGAGRIAGVKNESSGSYYAGAASSDVTNRIQYAPAGAVKAMKLGNGLWEHTNYNARLQPTEIGLGSVSTNSNVLQLDYNYGTSNNMATCRAKLCIFPVGLRLLRLMAMIHLIDCSQRRR